MISARRLKLNKLILVVIIIFEAFYLPVSSYKVYGAVSSCSASVSPTSIPHQKIGSAVTIINKDLTFSISNTSSTAVVWVKLTAPSSEFGVNGGSSSGWGTTNTSQTVTFTSGSLAAGASANFVVNVTPGTIDLAAAAWTVQVSDDAGGADPTTCGGSTSVEISGTGPDEEAPNFTNLLVSEVTSSSVKITWDTDESSNSSVDWGTTVNYGLNKSDSSMVTSHSLTFDGLSANTTYYYKAYSTDAAGNVGESLDNVFATAVVGATGTTVTGTTKTVTKTETKLVKDTTGPLVSLTTNFKRPYETAPAISGIASDDSGISKVEYTIDNGENWLPADSITNLFAKSTAFEFTPPIFDDGDYKIRVRAYDPTGNLGMSKIYTMVIDRLPPLVGTSLFSIGPLILEPNKNGSVLALSKLKQKVTLSSVGGAISIDILGDSQKFTLVKNIDSGLWSGAINFDKPGVFKLKAHSVDGAGNTTERNLNSVVVLDQGRVINSDGKAVKDAAITLYYFEPDQGQFVIWNGKPYVQENPQKTKDDGGYELFAPAGKYYIKVSASGYRTLNSEIFNLDRSTPINTNFTLRGGIGFKLGGFVVSLPSFFAPQVPVKLEYPEALENLTLKDNFAGRELTDFTLKMEDGIISSFDLRGKPAIITFLSSWSPYTFEQLNYLNKMDLGKGVNSLAVFVHESDSAAAIFKKRGAYKLQMAADPDGVLVTPLDLQSVPTHVFTDRKGVIQKTVVGVLTEVEVEENLVN